MENGYIIHFGNSNAPVPVRAIPNKKGDPSGEISEVIVRVGNHQVFRQARVWGRRIIGKESDPKRQTKLADGGLIQFNTQGYRGDLEFLKWGDEDGHTIEVRYIDQSQSLDYEYQENIQKIKVDPVTSSPYLDFQTGQNQLDYKREALKIQFLKVHPQNKGSVSKNPNPQVKGSTFYEIKEENVDHTSIKRIETASEAVQLVKEISNKPGNIRTLFRVLGIKKIGTTTDLSPDLEIYKTLIEYVNVFADEFYSAIQRYKDGVFDDFEKAKSFKVLDLTKNGHIALIFDGKPNLIMSDVKGKGEEMVNWMVDNYYDEEVYKATQMLKELLSKIK